MKRPDRKIALNSSNLDRLVFIAKLFTTHHILFFVVNRISVVEFETAYFHFYYQ